MKNILLGLLLAFTLGADAQIGNSPYTTPANATSYSGVLPRYYISGVQGSVSGQNLTYSLIPFTFATKTDTSKLFLGAWQNQWIPSDSLATALESDSIVVISIKSNDGQPAGSFTGDNLKLQIPMGTYGGVLSAATNHASIRGHINFRNKYGPYFSWTTGADSTTTISLGQTLYIEFQCTDGVHWLEKSKITK